jgi:hypothetical protein
MSLQEKKVQRNVSINLAIRIRQQTQKDLTMLHRSIARLKKSIKKNT